jgi:hypothetical protein
VCAEPVVHEEHAHAAARCIGQGGDEITPHGVVADDVIFEEDLFACSADRFLPRGVILSGVFEDANAIPGQQRCACGAQKDLIRLETERGAGCGHRRWGDVGHGVYLCAGG